MRLRPCYYHNSLQIYSGRIYWYQFILNRNSTCYYAGHNKWSKIFRSKAIEDGKRCQKIVSSSLEIISAIKANGSDSSKNQRLANAIEKAKALNVPKRIIDTAIAKGLGSLSYSGEFVLYECLGPFNVPLIVSARTDNRNRTYQELRSFLNDYEGSIEEPSSLLWKFTKKGLVEVVGNQKTSSQSLTDESMMELAMCLSCEDMEISSYDTFKFYCDPKNLTSLKHQLIEQSKSRFELEIVRCEIIYVPVDGFFSLEKFLENEMMEVDDDISAFERNDLFMSCINGIRNLNTVEQVFSIVDNSNDQNQQDG